MLGLNLVTGCKGNDFRLNRCVADGRWRLCRFVKTSNESSEKGLRCAKIRIGDREGPSRAIREIQVDSFFADSLSSCTFFSLPAFPSVGLFTRTDAISHLRNHTPLCAKKCRQVPVFVRTNDYDGADTSVRWCGRVRTKPITGAFDRSDGYEGCLFRVRNGIIM